MTELDALWAAVGASPEDQLPRLVLADWLEERVGEVDCGRGGGKGDWTSHKGPGTTGGIRFVECPTCNGTGRVSNGYAEMGAALRATADRVPRKFNGPIWGWNRLHGMAEPENYGSLITQEVYAELEADRIPYARAGVDFWCDYLTATAAIRDLCRAWIAVNCKQEVPA